MASGGGAGGEVGGASGTVAKDIVPPEVDYVPLMPCWLRTSNPKPMRIKMPGQKRFQLSQGAQPMFAAISTAPRNTSDRPATMRLPSTDVETDAPVCWSTGNTMASTMYASTPMPPHNVATTNASRTRLEARLRYS